ncbi:MAG: alkane 1-monooxygenase [Gammaproteobacteria bacterium TMED107]|nr:alkane 1-monooxygenase [Gammaproteobacteria bacterium]OUX77791.1 MAG: alkane 1-monooxygenase [Gammaproteobacteria bacterium TMED107]
MTTLSVLDLAPVPQGSSPAEALSNTLKLAQAAEGFGYHRYWVAEHHNMKGIASAATAVVIGHIANGTSTIRVGSGGIMLPNHAPLVVAEQFGTLASLYPGRIDLGLGRAPGTDQLTAHALRRNLTGSADSFPDDVVELQHYLREASEGQAVVATPGAGTDVPLWILGSSLFGAQLAAALGLPYAFASHFAPQDMMQAIAIYRERFKPSEQLQKPHVMLGYNVFVADTDEEALYLRSSALQSMLSLRRGNPIQLPPPVEGLEASLSAPEAAMLEMITRCSAVGSVQSAANQMGEFLMRTGADELMCVSSIYDHDTRVRSFGLALEARDLLSQKAA